MLAKILALQQADQRRRRLPQSVRNAFAILEAAVGDMLGEFLVRRRPTSEMLGNNETLHLEPVDQHGAEIPERIRRAVVLADQAADGDAAKGVHLREQLVEDLTADVFEQAVYSPRCRRQNGGRQITGLVVDAGIEAQFLGDIAALLASAGDADGMRAVQLGQLADDAANRPGGRRDTTVSLAAG